MKRAIWYFRLAIAYICLGWGISDSIKCTWGWYRWDDFKDYREDGLTPREAAMEDLSYGN